MSTSSRKRGHQALHGFLHPATGTAIDASAVLDALRGDGVLAGLNAHDLGVDDLCEIFVLADADERLLLLSDGALSRGPYVEEVGTALAAALGIDVELGDHLFEDPARPGRHESNHDYDDHAADGANGGFGDSGGCCGGDCGADGGEQAGQGSGEDDEFLGLPNALHPDVLVTKVPTEALPQLAEAVGSFDAIEVDGWTLALTEDVFVGLDEYEWSVDELPAAQLVRHEEERFLVVLHSFSEHGEPEAVVLARMPEPSTTYGPDELGAAADERTVGLFNPHLLPDSGLLTALAHPAFADRDPLEVAAALQRPEDDQWSAGVLGALGLPTLAAEVHEGRAPLED